MAWKRMGTFQKWLSRANPQYKSVTLYDSEMKRVQKESLGIYLKQDKSEGKDVKQEQKQDIKL